MSGVDVLAVMDTACRLHEEGVHGDAWEAEFRAVYEARAAVAELIDAAREVAAMECGAHVARLYSAIVRVNGGEA